MNRSTLAKALRRRQLRAKLVDASAVRGMTDAELLACYTECSKCGERIFADSDAAVRTSADVQEFLTLVNMGLAAHQCRK